MILERLFGSNRESIFEITCGARSVELTTSNVFVLGDDGNLYLSNNMSLGTQPCGQYGFDLDENNDETLSLALSQARLDQPDIIYIDQADPDLDNLEMVLRVIGSFGCIHKVGQIIAKDDYYEHQPLQLEVVLNRVGLRNYYPNDFYDVDSLDQDAYDL